MIDFIHERIHAIRSKLPDSVRLIAVTKTVTSEVIRSAYDAGIRDFGENRIQEAISKQNDLQDLTDINWHFIVTCKVIKPKKHCNTFPGFILWIT